MRYFYNAIMCTKHLQSRLSGCISPDDSSLVDVGLSVSPAFTPVASGCLTSFPLAAVSKTLSLCLGTDDSCGGSSVEFGQHQIQSECTGFSTLKLDFMGSSTYWCLQESPIVLGRLCHVNKHISSPSHHNVQSTLEASHGVVEAEYAHVPRQWHWMLPCVQAWKKCRGGSLLGDLAEDYAMQLHP